MLEENSAFFFSKFDRNDSNFVISEHKIFNLKTLTWKEVGDKI